MLRRSFLLALALALLPACPGPLSEDPPRRLRIGEWVLSPWSRWPRDRLYAGKVESQYGKLVGIRYPLGCQGWTAAGELVPPGLPEPDPGDAPGATVGTRVLSPGLQLGEPAGPGTVVEVYGKLALVDYDGGDLGWVEGAILQPLAGAAAPQGPPPSSGPPAVLGARVTASRGGGPPEAARVAELHGRLVYLYFEDGVQAWVDAASLVPPAGAAPEPQRTTTIPHGTLVTAPSPSGRGVVLARVLDGYGRLVRLAYDGGGEGWARSWELSPR